jgi:hypothetical protein
MSKLDFTAHLKQVIEIFMNGAVPRTLPSSPPEPAA